ncbi:MULTISPECIES: ribosome-associated protein YbcJ [Xenorhabdus]|uniref:ribosome-associated protein YbcJ n=1 Tax=Xenorhabdus TaxID=626 RepID=UPI00064A02B5|nr:MULTISPECIES: ribosome-associated protein YbcJ [Xenorhabdus]KLU14998.1 ribosome-associated protein [Xenorhabdus griffiniae]KOP34801.1 ribosome-associated protein [Xenorhabdus sp. GDc328]WFQ79750.1 ribosome-associated protein YbcJ [Xenorhabdus sp. SF857]
MKIFYLDDHPYVELCDLLKFQGWCESGAAAKAVIAEGLVQVDSQLETRKRCKITAGKVVAFNGESVRVEE